MSQTRIDRPTNIHLGGVDLALPAFFPSVSSIKTNLSPFDYVQLLASTGMPQFLVSAYDLANCPEQEAMTATIDAALRERTIILLDSGNYESYWMRDLEWTKTRFHEVLKAHRWPIAFSFDLICKLGTSAEHCAKKIADSCLEDQGCQQECALLPIIHGLSDDLPSLCGIVASFLNPLVIAVPERELGDGILARIATVRQIRRHLNRLGAYYPLHLLGTGNPYSMLLYTAAGADMFDGLEWCQTVADPKSAHLFHFQQRELLADQLVFGEVQGYSETTLVHNLFFYSTWMRQLHGALVSESLSDHIKDKFSLAIAAKVEATLHAS
jgi:queuine/archaeosine tRNA-ribosyltransferase